MSATAQKAAIPPLQEFGDAEAIVYVAFERAEGLAGQTRQAVEDDVGASAEDCWRMHFAASYMISWGESLIEKAKEIQSNVHDLGLHGVESGAIAEPWPGMADVPEKTNQALERIIAQRRADDA